MMRALGLAGLALTLAACAPQPGTQPTAPVVIDDIGDTPWQLVSIGSTEVGPPPVVLNIAGGFINGRGPCNQINANYLGTAPAFKVEVMTSTKMICDRQGLEMEMISAMMGADTARVADGILTITGPESEMLVFKPAAAGAAEGV